MKFKKITLLAFLLITSQVHAWQPSGWVYQMGDYQYEYESGDWYWKMNWDFWHTNPGAEDWTKNSANGWNYYTYPYFYSTSMGQWRFASDPGSGADIVNLNTGSWSKFGQETQTAFAPTTIEEGTIIESSYGSYFFGSNNGYVLFGNDTGAYSLGTFNYARTGPNTAQITFDGRLRTPEDSTDIYSTLDFTFTAQDTLNISGGIGAATLRIAKYDMPSSLSGLSFTASGYEYNNITGFPATYGSRVIAFSTSTALTTDGDKLLSVSYDYIFRSPYEAQIIASGYDPDYGSFEANYFLCFDSFYSGYYVSLEEFTDLNYTESGWGNFSLLE